MYASRNFKSKKQFKEAVQAGEKVTLWSPGMGTPPVNGSTCVEGPHYPEPHRWYATVTVVGGIVTKVK
jgi:hypothetical protein